MNIVDLECNGGRVEVNGIRLKNLEIWRTEKANSAINALTPLSGQCNCNCIFCFEKKHPFRQNLSIMSFEEAKTRLKYYSIDGHCLFPSDRVFKEIFANPNAIEFWSKLVKKHQINYFILLLMVLFLKKKLYKSCQK